MITGHFPPLRRVRHQPQCHRAGHSHVALLIIFASTDFIGVGDLGDPGLAIFAIRLC